MLEIDIEIEDLKEAGRRLDEEADKAIERRADLAAYVEKLKEEFSGEDYEPIEPLGKEIVKDVEDFLRHTRPDES